MAVHYHIRFKRAQQVLKVRARKLESLCAVVQRQKNRVVNFPRVAGLELSAPIGQLFEAVLHTRLICNVVGVTGKGINRRQRISPVTGDKIRGGGEILVMTARQPAALRVSRMQLGFRCRHKSEPASYYRASRAPQETRLCRATTQLEADGPQPCSSKGNKMLSRGQNLRKLRGTGVVPASANYHDGRIPSQPPPLAWSL